MKVKYNLSEDGLERFDLPVSPLCFEEKVWAWATITLAVAFAALVVFNVWRAIQ